MPPVTRLGRLRQALVRPTNLCWLLGAAAFGFGLWNSHALVWVGVGLFVCCLALPAVTLFVELDASARARKLALAAGVLQSGERQGMDRVLQAAALTYLAKTITTLVGVLGVVLFVALVGWEEGDLLHDQMIMLVLAVGVTVALMTFQARRVRAATAPGPGPLNNLGNALAHQGDYTEAVASFTRALGVDPRYAEAYANRGATYARMGQYDAALADLAEAIRLDPGLLDAYRCRASLLLIREDYDGAIRDYTEALQRGGDRAASLRDRGLAYLGKRDLGRAVTDLDEAVHLNPRDAVAFNNRGVALQKRGDPAQAAADLREAIRLDPALPNGYKNLAWLQATCPDPTYRNGADAVANAARALRLAGGQEPTWLCILAAAHAEVGDFAEAVRVQEECLAAVPEKEKAELQARLNLYRTRQPFREIPAPRPD
jgi:tetratricopeptide (TPR) repeat protein